VERTYSKQGQIKKELHNTPRRRFKSWPAWLPSRHYAPHGRVWSYKGPRTSMLAVSPNGPTRLVFGAIAPNEITLFHEGRFSGPPNGGNRGKKYG
jgi:hypothetical protein